MIVVNISITLVFAIPGYLLCREHEDFQIIEDKIIAKGGEAVIKKALLSSKILIERNGNKVNAVAKIISNRKSSKNIEFDKSELRKKFLFEVSIMNYFDHPNFAKVIGFDESPVTIYLMID